MYQQMIVPQNIEQTRKFYATDEELIEDIGKAYQDVIKQFYAAGCRNLQLDDCTWGAIVGDAAKQRYQSLGVDIEEVKSRLLKVNNLALENRPEDMVITSHICRAHLVNLNCQHIFFFPDKWCQIKFRWCEAVLCIPYKLTIQPQIHRLFYTFKTDVNSFSTHRFI